MDSIQKYVEATGGYLLINEKFDVLSILDKMSFTNNRGFYVIQCQIGFMFILLVLNSNGNVVPKVTYAPEFKTKIIYIITNRQFITRFQKLGNMLFLRL